MSSFDNCKRNFKNGFQLESYPSIDLHEEEILIVVKTAPTPSIKYRETVCISGVTKKGRWIRLYPIPFRYINFYQRFQKYQWIKVKIKKNINDNRVDSYRPDVKSIKPLGKPLSTRNGWRERKEIILPTVSPNLEELIKNYEKNKVSLGVFKPKQIERLYIEASEEGWSEKHQKVLSQLVLFGKQTKKLEKVPFKFSYKFTCNNENCRGHKLKIIDWEIYELYRKMREKFFPAMDMVSKKIKQKWYDEMYGKDREIYLIVGTVYPRKSFVILGVFWPPKTS